MLIQIEI